MRTSQYLLATLKESPTDAELISHQLMLRSGMIRLLGKGLYTWLPLGLRVLNKVKDIVREEMDNTGALELLMPTVQPAELWQETGRWEEYGPLLLKIQDRHQRDFCFGPTHEEVITDIMRRELRSYKQLPINFYQIQTKFRDEIRPRFGVMRAREFVMKDAYSFHTSQISLEETYERMHQAYQNIFSRLGLHFRSVAADSGSIGGKTSHEFQVLANSGEDTIAYSSDSQYAANVELAEALPPIEQRDNPGNAMAMIATPGQTTIAQISEFLQVKPSQTVKTLIVKGEEQPLVALVLRGDHDLNDIKAEKLPQVATPFAFASEEEIKQNIGCAPGYIGPVGLQIPIIADHSALQVADFICGANEKGNHLQHVNWARDCPEPITADIRKVVSGDPSPDGKGTLSICRGIEVGHIFQLDDKYSKAMNATVLDENGKAVTMMMGCYGIGVSRIVAAAIEQNHDDKGIIWPKPMAPFQVAIVPINMRKNDKVRQACESLYEQLQAAGMSVLFDDRDERPGIMFANMDLIGIPHRIVVSEKSLANNNIEYKHRKASDSEHISLDEIIDFLCKA